MFKIVIILFGLTVFQSIYLTESVVGGREVSIAKYPHHVSIRYRSCNACAYSHICGGSIYSQNIIITAAYCAIGRKNDSLIIVAATENRNGADGVPVLVKKIVINENYDPITKNNDIAILFLSSSLPINNVTIREISLADVQPDKGIISYVTGWGATSEGGHFSNKLLEVKLSIISNEFCDKAYGGERITNSMLCAGFVDGGKDACQGDTGGPLVVKGQLAGVVSWGRGCARPRLPGVYSSVAYFNNWILDIVNKMS